MRLRPCDGLLDGRILAHQFAARYRLFLCRQLLDEIKCVARDPEWNAGVRNQEQRRERVQRSRGVRLFHHRGAVAEWYEDVVEYDVVAPGATHAGGIPHVDN